MGVGVLVAGASGNNTNSAFNWAQVEAELGNNYLRQGVLRKPHPPSAVGDRVNCLKTLNSAFFFDKNGLEYFK